MELKKTHVLVLVIFTMVLSGCSSTGVINQANLEIEELKTKVDNLEKIVDKQSKSIESQMKTIALQSKTIDELKLEDKEQTDNLLNWMTRPNEDSFSLGINTAGYDISQTEYGSILLSVESAEQYLDGYKISFKIGNLTSANFSDVDFVIVTSESRLEGFRKKLGLLCSTNYENYTHVKQKVSETIKAGSWNRVTITVPDTTLDELEYFYVVLLLDTVSLSSK